MFLYHVTPASNEDSICSSGLLLRYAQTVDPAVYAAAYPRLIWAVEHTRRRHRADILSVFELDVDLSVLPFRPVSSLPGLWSCPVDVPPDRLKLVARLCPPTRSLEVLSAYASSLLFFVLSHYAPNVTYI